MANPDGDLIAQDLDSSFARQALHHAVEGNDVPRVRTLLETGVDPNAYCDSTCMPGPLFRACSVEMVSLLLTKAAAVGARSRNGCTPLHYAAIRCGEEPRPESYGVIEALVRAAADVNAKTSDGCTPLEVGYRCIAIAGKQAPSMRPATRIEFWLRRALLALLRAGALVSNVRRADLREPLKRFADFDQYCADHRRVWVSVVTKCAAVPRDAASVAVATFIPRDAAGVVAAFVSPAAATRKTATALV